MHPYLHHLLRDIYLAHQTEQPDEPSYAKSFEEEMEEIERWLEVEEHEHTFGYYCGLQSENFPPPDQLTTEEIEIVNKAFEKMMYTWNLGTDFPRKLPAERVYSLLVKTLNEKTRIPASGFVSFDYCSGYAPDCIFKEYCCCLQFWNQRTDEDTGMPDSKDDDLPF